MMPVAVLSRFRQLSSYDTHASVTQDGFELLAFGGFAGLASLLVAVVVAAAQVGDLVEKWALYLTLGLTFVVALGGAARRHVDSPRWIRGRVTIGLCAIVAAMTVLYVVFSARYYVLLPATLQMVIVVLQARSSGSRPPPLLATLIAIVIAWTLATSLVFWARFDDWVLGSLFASSVFMVAFCLALMNNANPPLKTASNTFSVAHAWDMAALVLIALASYRQLPLDAVNFHHWGVYVGPAQMVQQGGWLLWDVPSQYGFLNILALAWLPTTTLWQSVYVLDGLLIFASTAFLFIVLRSLRTGRTNFWFALAVSSASALLLTGRAELLSGPQYFPSSGPLRFFWCYALLAVLALESWSSLGRRWRQRTIWVGHVVWLLGAWWSFESAAYCTLIWFPSLMIISRALQLERGGASGSTRGQATTSVAVIRAPIGLFLLSLGALALFYQLRLGRPPDWFAYTDYVAAFSTGFLSVELDPFGAVGALLLAFGVLAGVAIGFARAGVRSRQLGLVVGCVAAVWSTSSYMVPNSSSQQVCDLGPLWCTCIALSLLAVQREVPPEASWLPPLRASLVPLFSVLLTAAFANQTALATIISSPASAYTNDMDQRLPTIDPALRDLLHIAGARLEDPIVTTDLNLLPRRAGSGEQLSMHERQLDSSPTAWTPISPLALIAVLPDARRREYLRRFAATSQSSGWLVEHASEDYRTMAWIAEPLLDNYRPTRMYANDAWRLIWFEWNGN